MTAFRGARDEHMTGRFKLVFENAKLEALLLLHVPGATLVRCLQLCSWVVFFLPSASALTLSL